MQNKKPINGVLELRFPRKWQHLAQIAITRYNSYQKDLQQYKPWPIEERDVRNMVK